jgi:hypothetical protein
MPLIYESPDGGQTIYQRELGRQRRRQISGSATQALAGRRLLWAEILLAAQTDAELQHMIQQVEIYHALRYNNT